MQNDDTSVVDLGRRGFKIIQSKDGFRLGTDSVLLAWFASSLVKKNSDNYPDDKKPRLLELGSNCGGCGMCVAARKANVYLDETEIMPEAFGLLEKNIELNNVSDRCRAFMCDIRQMPPEIKNTQYDVVFFNPPFYNRDRGPSGNISKTERLAARFEENGNLEDFVCAAAARVKPSSGYVAMIMRSERLVETMNLFLKYRITPNRLVAVHSFADRDAYMFLLAGRRGAFNADMRILPPLILNIKNEENGCIITTDRMLSLYGEEHSDCFI